MSPVVVVVGWSVKRKPTVLVNRYSAFTAIFEVRMADDTINRTHQFVMPGPAVQFSASCQRSAEAGLKTCRGERDMGVKRRPQLKGFWFPRKIPEPKQTPLGAPFFGYCQFVT